MTKCQATCVLAAVVMSLSFMGGCRRAENVTAPVLPAPKTAFTPILASDFHVIAGAKRALGSYVMKVNSGGMRGVAPKTRGRSAELAFSYHGPSVVEARLADGVLRRQIGIALQEQDVCNVIYIMWHIEPTKGVYVSVKINPGQSTHEECLDRGYTIVTPNVEADAPVITVGEARIVRAQLVEDTLHVWIDKRLVWEGLLPRSVRTLNGPIGVRSDNGDFDFELRGDQLED
jgi:hypothetical protein